MLNEYIYVNFLPWLTIYESVKLGKITFWNYERESEERIKDERIRNRLDKHFDSYRSANNSKVPITVCSFEGKNFSADFNEREYNDLRESITALTFASTVSAIEEKIQEKIDPAVPPSMNSFDIISRNLNLNTNDYSHISLSLFDFGLKDGSRFFQKPLATRSDIFPHRKWIKYLNSYLGLKKSNQLRNHISRGLEFFRLAQAQDDLKDNSQEVSFFTRTVLLSIAFESLLNFPVNGKADFFANYINQRFTLANSIKSSRRIRKNKPKIQYSAVAWWAYDFYKLRNSIVHGNKVVLNQLRFKEGLPFSQMDIAVVVFADCLEEIALTKFHKPSRNYLKRIVEQGFEDRGVENWQKHHKVLRWIR